MFTRSAALLISVVAATFASTASAAPETVDMSFTGTGKGRNVKVTYNSSDRNLFVGQLKHTISTGTGWASSLVGDHRTYCADLDQYVSGTTSVFSVQPVSARASQVDGSRAPDITSALTNIYVSNGPAAAAATASEDFASAFQIAVWEIIYDYNADVGLASIDLTAGHTRFASTNGSPLSSGIMTQFNNIIASVGLESGGPGLYALMSGQRQDQLIYVQGLIPTPGSATLMALGSLAFIHRRRPAR
jgi:hypothetical protein